MTGRWVTREDGLLQCVDDTGSVLFVQSVKPERRAKIKPAKSRPDHHYVQDSRGRTIWVPVGTDPDDLVSRLEYPFSETTWEHVCRLVTEGHSLRKISSMEGFPPQHALYRWLRREEVRKEFEAAKRARADYRYDQALEIADQGKIDCDDAPGERLRADIYKWAASVDCPDVYGKQTKITGDANNPVVIHVSTGVPDPKPESSLPLPAIPSPEPLAALSPTPVDFVAEVLE